MLKKYFKPKLDEIKEATKKIKWKMRTDWKFIEDSVKAAGSVYDTFNMTSGVSIYEGFKNKKGPKTQFTGLSSRS